MIKAATVSIGTSATLIYTAVGDTHIKIRNGNSNAVAIGDSTVSYPGGYMLSKDTPEATVLDLDIQDGDSVYGRAGVAGTVINYIATN